MIILALVLVSTLAAQSRRSMDNTRSKNMFGRDLFLYRYYNFADSSNEQSSLMKFYFGVVNDLLTFIKTDQDNYKARYEILVIVYNDKKEAIVERSVSDRLIVDSYVETNLRRDPKIHTISVSLPPGRYDSVIQLNDLEAGETIVKELEMTFRDFGRQKLRLSDIIFINSIDSTDSEFHFEPNLTHVFDDVNSAFSAYIELYPPKPGNPVKAKLGIYSEKGDELHSMNREYTAGDKERISAVIPFRDFLKKPGEYYFVVEAQSGKQTAKIQRLFSVFWGNIPMAKNNIDMAIEQLSLVADKATVGQMRDAEPDQREELFDAFWQQRDPTPNTQRNELREEFFRRVDFSNRTFTEITSGRPGWQSDRGKIYIVYGAPDQVDRQDSQIKMPTSEIWYYNRLNRKYFFVDRNGEGVYRLVKVE